VNALFRWLDIDRVQWRALVHRTLQIDFAMVQRAQKRGGKIRTGIGGIIVFSLLIYSFAGVSPAILTYQSHDPLLGATVLSTMVAFMVVSTLLVGEGATIVSPNDHLILGFRPVTSRTYLAVRVTTMALRTIFISTCVAFMTVLVFLLKGGRGLHWGPATAALLAAWATGIAMTLAVVAMYGWLLRLAGPQRMLRWASYMQFTVQMLTWIVFVVVTQDIGKRVMAGVTLAGTPWALAYPGAWFGSYVMLAAGDVGISTVVAAILSLSLVAALLRTIGGKLSLDYAENLGGLASAAAPRAVASETPAWLRLLNHETRAVSILVRSHLKHDTRFRLGLISLLPITLVYMMMGGRPPDPFVNAKGAGEVMVIQMALFFLPLTLRRVLVTSEAWRAAWVFMVTPADRARLVMSARNLIMLFFLAPYLLFLFVLFAWSFGHWWHAALHTLFTGMLSFLVLQFMVMVGPQLPFSLPHDKESRGVMMFGLMMFAAVAGLGLYFFLRNVVYDSAFRMAAAAVAFVALGWLMDRVTRRRARALVMLEG
jgi:hypothetical protein